ncbi:ATP-binding protein [Streptomyces sp. NPDC051018]|uniref:ATP-binding protein n=1 Tax=Streptomyces sp. NPDC051018 TaxID=3365639 RepID=UPI0037B40C4B
MSPLAANLLEATFPVQSGATGSPDPGDLWHVGIVRRLTRVCLDRSGLGRVTDDASLVVSELVTNAVVHSNSTRVTLTLGLHGRYLLIAVHDGGSARRCPEVRYAGDDEEGGRGMFLVQQLASARDGAWGTSDGTTWCALAR